jgi:hypothetical protein
MTTSSRSWTRWLSARTVTTALSESEVVLPLLLGLSGLTLLLLGKRLASKKPVKESPSWDPVANYYD